MRAIDITLVLLVLGCGILVLARDGGDREELRKLNSRMDEVDRSLANAATALESLLGEEKPSQPELLGTRGSEAPDLSVIDNRIARIEKHLGTMSNTIERLALRLEPRPARGTAPASAKKKWKGPPDPAAVRGWMDKLEVDDEDIVFSATIELARLGAAEAVPGLVRVLETHRDFYARLGAATALGEIGEADAVTPLIEGLNDKDDLVRTASSEALRRITGQDLNFVSGLTKNERQRIQRKFREWWRDNETAVRRRIEATK